MVFLLFVLFAGDFRDGEVTWREQREASMKADSQLA